MNNPVKTSIASLISLSVIFGVVLYFMLMTGDYIYSMPLMFMLFGKFFLMLAMRKFANHEIDKGSILVKRSTFLYFVGFSILFLLFFLNLSIKFMILSIVVYLLLSIYLFNSLKKFMKYR